MTAAFSVSGHTGPFLFTGFLPRKRSALAALLRQHLAAPHALVFFESPHRIVASLRVAAEVLGADRRIVVAREISKMHEEILCESIASLVDSFAQRGQVKGEFTGIVGPSVAKKGRAKRMQEEEEDGEEDDDHT